ncbi:MAG: dienelactone hydrolase family protein [Haloarculaceae archaeon]
MSETVRIPGARDVRATLDGAAGREHGDAHGESGGCVVACPPHPQMGGSRSDARLRAVSDALGERGVACLRFDYGSWDEGEGERRDARNAASWAGDRFERVGLFGYSFGGCIALLAAADRDDVAAVSALAPAAGIGDGLDAADALDSIPCPVGIVYGERDDTADWKPVVERARDLNVETVGVPADHHFVGQRERVAERVADFLADEISA